MTMRNPASESKFFKNSVYPFCVNFGKITNFYGGFLSLFSHLYNTSPIDFIDSMNRIFPKNLQKNWNNSMDLLQVLIGPRQVGKTTAILELAKVLIY